MMGREEEVEEESEKEEKREEEEEEVDSQSRSGEEREFACLRVWEHERRSQKKNNKRVLGQERRWTRG